MPIVVHFYTFANLHLDGNQTVWHLQTVISRWLQQIADDAGFAMTRMVDRLAYCELLFPHTQAPAAVYAALRQRLTPEVWAHLRSDAMRCSVYRRDDQVLTHPDADIVMDMNFEDALSQPEWLARSQYLAASYLARRHALPPELTAFIIDALKNGSPFGLPRP